MYLLSSSNPNLWKTWFKSTIEKQPEPKKLCFYSWGVGIGKFEVLTADAIGLSRLTIIFLLSQFLCVNITLVIHPVACDESSGGRTALFVQLFNMLSKQYLIFECYWSLFMCTGFNVLSISLCIGLLWRCPVLEIMMCTCSLFCPCCCLFYLVFGYLI